MGPLRGGYNILYRNMKQGDNEPCKKALNKRTRLQFITPRMTPLYFWLLTVGIRGGTKKPLRHETKQKKSDRSAIHTVYDLKIELLLY